MSAAFAFSAGVLAAFNPCGAAMLPGWLGYYLLGDEPARGDLLARLLRAIGTSLAVTVGLVAVFGVIGVALDLGLVAIRDVLPFVILALGIALTGIGAVVWRGGNMPSLRFHPLAAQRRHTVGATVGFGAAYGVAALSCALPVFLISVGAVHDASFSHRVLGTAGFTAGMASVLAVITVAATFVDDLASRLIALRRVMPRVSALLLIGAGAWTIYAERRLQICAAHQAEKSPLRVGEHRCGELCSLELGGQLVGRGVGARG